MGDSAPAVLSNGLPMKVLSPLLAAPTYAKARLALGISGVGTFVVLSIIAAAARLPHRIFEEKDGGLFTDASLLAVWLAAVALLTLPFEALGGYFLPKRHGRRHLEGGDWAVSWLRGALVVTLTMSLSGALVILGGTYAGRIGAIGMLGLVVVSLAGLQGWIARLVGGLRVVRPELGALEDELRTMGFIVPEIVVFDSEDEGFTGGIVGLPTAEKIVLPLRWVATLETKSLAVLVARRSTLVDRGMRAMGLGGAMAWTLVAFGLATYLPGAGVAGVAELLTTSLWFTVLSFMGLLFLPTPSRAAAIAADAFVVENDEDRKCALIAALQSLDRFADDEPERTEQVERIFHPVPSLGSRRRALENPITEVAPWHLARTAIFLSIAALNPLSRLVHCNAGRPDLWIFLPADG